MKRQHRNPPNKAELRQRKKDALLKRAQEKRVEMPCGGNLSEAIDARMKEYCEYHHLSVVSPKKRRIGTSYNHKK